MIDGLKPYPNYKDSGVPWLGEVPAHWEVRSLGSLTSPISQRGQPDLPLLSVVREKGVIPRTSMSEDENHNFVPDDLSNYKVVRKGNLVINKMKAWQGSLGIASMDGIVSPAYFVFDFRIGDQRFGQALLRSKTYVAFFAHESDGVRIGQWDLSIHGMKRIPVVVPPLPEQTAIVRFLDYVDRRIRRYIRAKQKLIKLLEEYKQALIHQAVTGKIDVRTGQPYPAYKPSGVEWLGEVPSHWEVVPIKRAFSSMDYGISESGSDSGTIRLLTMGHLKNGQVIIPDTGGVDTVDPNLLLSPGDLLFNRTNSAELVGKVALFSGYESPVTFASYLVRMRPTKENEPEFLNLVLNDASTLSRARREAIPSLHQSNLNPTRYGRLCIALPPKAEQQAILQRLREQTENVDTAISAARREIDLLREYRTRLIADVVTGRVDVREVAARLPEEPPEEEAELMDTEEIAEGEATDEEAAAEALSEEVEP